MKKMHKGFTLVELVVVITILAILGTVALLSFRGYSGDARNSKRITDLNSIKNNVTEQITNGVAVMNFIGTAVTDNLLSPGGSTYLAGQTITALGAAYNAGTINYPTINLVQEDFADPSTNSSYVIGASSKMKGVYQIAAKLDAGEDGLNHAFVVGNFKPRHTTATAGYITAGAIAVSGTTTTNLIANITSGTNINVFKTGDTISCTPACSPAGTRLISKISPDGATITFSTAPGVALTAISIANADAAGLIDEGTSAADGVIVNDGTTNFPY